MLLFPMPAVCAAGPAACATPGACSDSCRPDPVLLAPGPAAPFAPSSGHQCGQRVCGRCSGCQEQAAVRAAAQGRPAAVPAAEKGAVKELAAVRLAAQGRPSYAIPAAEKGAVRGLAAVHLAAQGRPATAPSGRGTVTWPACVWVVACIPRAGGCVYVPACRRYASCQVRARKRRSKVHVTTRDARYATSMLCAAAVVWQ